MKDTINVACITMCSRANYTDNINEALSKIRHAISNGAEWIVLPEVFSFIGSSSRIHSLAETDCSELIQNISKVSKEFSVVIFAGSLPEKIDGSKKVYNTTFVFGKDGSIIGKYRKIHLFSLFDENNNPILNENINFEAGSRPVSINVEGWKVGLSICYDLRFPELYRYISQKDPADAFIVPAAFTYTTGKDHWEILLRARAIENQCYVLAANQVGSHSENRRSFGNSMIIDPWGTIISSSGESTATIHSTLSKTVIQSSRSKVPALANRHQKLQSK